MGFLGYIDNIQGIYKNIQEGFLSTAEYKEKTNTVIQGEVYPHLSRDDPVKNDIDLEKNSILTGVNASGKTTLLKTTTLSILFSQQCGFGFFESCILEPYTHIHSYLNIPDTSGRDSLFQAESRRCKDILSIIESADKESRHFCIFDELYSGTNPEDASKAAYAFLLYLDKKKNVDFMLTTHYTNICKKLERKAERIRNYKMESLQNEKKEIVFSYKVKQGICKIQGGCDILRKLDYPEEIIQTMQETHFEKQIKFQDEPAKNERSQDTQDPGSQDTQDPGSQDTQDPRSQDTKEILPVVF
jgi:DNA mismatch repair ATPase MutS